MVPPSPRSTAGVVLAGGVARRLGGRDKALLQVGGKPLLARTLATLAQVTQTQLVVGRPERHAGFGAAVVADLRPGAGPLAGLETALTHVTTPHVILVACDLPFLPVALLEALLAQPDTAEVVVPIAGAYLEPLCARYARRLLPRVSAALDAGLRKMTACFDEAQVVRLDLDAIPGVFPEDLLNCNTPEVLAEARRRATGAPLPDAP